MSASGKGKGKGSQREPVKVFLAGVDIFNNNLESGKDELSSITYGAF